MRVVHEQGFCDEATRDKDWIGYAELLTSGAEPLEEFERVKEIVARFTRSRTKAELLDLAVERNLLIAPVSTIEDLVASAQLAAREYFRDARARRAAARRVRHPGPFARFGRSPIVYAAPPRRASTSTEREIRAALASAAGRRRSTRVRVARGQPSARRRQDPRPHVGGRRPDRDARARRLRRDGRARRVADAHRREPHAPAVPRRQGERAKARRSSTR